MLRIQYYVCILLALCLVVKADRWPAGGVEHIIGNIIVASSSPSTQRSYTSTCYASRQATVVPAPLNAQCPPDPSNPNANLCTVPTYCPTNSTDALCPSKEYQRFDASGVQAHFQNQPPGFPMVNVKTSTYSCVDARADDPMLGTPGRDLSELMNAAMAIMKLSPRAYTNDTMNAIADDVFDGFAAYEASSSRPLYFHTDDASLRRMFIYLQDKLGTMPTILPFRGPISTTEQNIWLEALTRPEHNGCGHIRLQMNPAYSRYYSILKTTQDPTTVQSCGNSTATCIDSLNLAQRMVTKFYRYWWFTASGSFERRKIAFAVDGILLGPLLGKAVAVIKNTPTDQQSGATCADHAPLVKPTFGASKVFVYHPDAVTTWRTYISNRPWLSAILAKYGVTSNSRFAAVWQSIAGMQLGATLTYLKPANNVGLFQVNVPVGTSSYLTSQRVQVEAGPATGAAAGAVVASEPVPAVAHADSAVATPDPLAAAHAATAAASPIEPMAATAAVAGR